MSGPPIGPRRLAALALLALAAGSAHTADAYLKFGTVIDGRSVELRWTSPGPVRYFVSDEGGPGVSPGDLAAAAERAFGAWAAVPTSSITFERAGFTGASAREQDGVSTLGFEDAPEMDLTLAATSYLIDVRTGEILEADIFFNSAFPWSAAGQGEPGRFDLQSIVTHEAGHFLGLGHSAIGETELQADGRRRLIGSGAVMFPIAFGAGRTLGRTLMPDDVAGVSDMYAAGGFRRETGTIQGRVVRGGRGLYGVHVTAFDLRTGALVGSFTLDDDGSFAIAGLSPGTHLVRAEPLDDGDVESFLEDPSSVDVDFRATYYPRLVTVTAGGGTDAITIEVTPR